MSLRDPSRLYRAPASRKQWNSHELRSDDQRMRHSAPPLTLGFDCRVSHLILRNSRVDACQRAVTVTCVDARSHRRFGRESRSEPGTARNRVLGWRRPNGRVRRVVGRTDGLEV